MARRGTIATTIGITTRGRRLFLLVLTAWRVSSCSTPRCEDEQWRSALQDELYAIGRSDDWSELADDALAPFVSPFELCVLAASRAGDDWAAQRRACAHLAKSSCAGDFSLRMGDGSAKPRGAQPARPAPTAGEYRRADGPRLLHERRGLRNARGARAPRRARRRSRACSTRSPRATSASRRSATRSRAVGAQAARVLGARRRRRGGRARVGSGTRGVRQFGAAHPARGERELDGARGRRGRLSSRASRATASRGALVVANLGLHYGYADVKRPPPRRRPRLAFSSGSRAPAARPPPLRPTARPPRPPRRRASRCSSSAR